MTIEERIAALEARVAANKESSERAIIVAEKAMDRAEDAVSKRFDSSNEIREAMRDQSRNYVTRGEFQWAMGTVVLFLIGALVKILYGQ